MKTKINSLTSSFNSSFWIKITGLMVLIGFLGDQRLANAQAPGFTEISDKVIAAGLTWTGGAAPFLLQKKITPSDASWVNIISTSNSNVLLPKDSDSGFFRLQNQVTNTVIAFSALLGPGNETPPVTNSTGSGIGTMSLEGSNLTYYISYTGLTGPATFAHFHAPGTPTNSTGVLIGLSPPSSPSGVISGTLTLTPQQITNFINGLTYVNIHTSSNGTGEIRGHVVPLRMVVFLNGAAEENPVVTPGTANGTLTFIGSHLFYDIQYSNLSSNATAAHIHGPATTTNSASVLVPLATPSGTSGTISGDVVLTPQQLAFVLSGQTYVNIHTLANAGGEIRGQIWPFQLGATLDGASEVPQIVTPATGTASMTVISNLLSYSVTYTNLSSSAFAAHIHGPADLEHSGNVLIGLTSPTGTNGNFSGSVVLTPIQLFYIISGQTYVNIHTSINGNGEIRGQLYPAN